MRGERWMAAALAVAVAGPAFAYSLVGWDWDWQSNPLSTPFYLNASSFPSRVGTQQQVTDAFRNAANTWESEGQANFSFTWGGTTSSTSWSGDGVLITQFSSTTASGGTLAISQSWGWGGDMTDCDQRYYNRNAYGQINWSADPLGAGWSEMDLEYVALHEYGHCLGLDHSSSLSAIMYASASAGTGPSDRHLGSDDRAGIQAMYGAAVSDDLVLSIGGTLYAGRSKTFTVSGADPGETIHLLASTGGLGAGPCPAIMGGAVCLDIRSPVTRVATGVANGQGVASITLTVPSTLAGWTLAFQAGALRGPGNQDSVVSNAEASQVMP